MKRVLAKEYGGCTLPQKRMLSPRHFLTLVISMVCAFSASAEDFLLSYWCGPPGDKDVEKRYAEVAQCGFNYAMMACSGGLNNQAVLDACQKNKLKFIVYDPRILAYGPESPAFKTNLDSIISAYARHPATGGYFLADEPGPDAFRVLGAVNQYLLAHDPKHLPFINLLPNYAPEWALGGSYEGHVEKYLSTVKPRLLSFDHYTLLNNGTEGSRYFQNLEVIRRQGLKHNVPTALIFLATAHGSYRVPKEAELLWQANSGLIYGTRGLLYFTYWTPSADPAFKESNAIIDAQGTRSPLYDMTRRVNAGINAWAPTLMKLKSTGVYHTGKMPSDTQPVPKNLFVQIKEEGPIILGTFLHEDGSDWLMIMNRDLHGPSTATLQFNQKTKRLKELSRAKGKLATVKFKDQELAVPLTAGEARLFRIFR
jgi:hypothetical protein